MIRGRRMRHMFWLSATTRRSLVSIQLHFWEKKKRRTSDAEPESVSTFAKEEAPFKQPFPKEMLGVASAPKEDSGVCARLLEHVKL